LLVPINRLVVLCLRGVPNSDWQGH
jgi:hypothetical protein